MRPPHPNAPGPLLGIDEAIIERVVDTFYQRVRSDNTLAQIFEPRVSHWPDHLQKLTEFWCSVLLMTGQYKGTPLVHHVAIPNLTERHFKQWLALFRMSVEEHCDVEQTELFMSRAERIATSFQIAIAMKQARNAGEYLQNLPPLKLERTKA
jgi:hemoglobin